MKIASVIVDMKIEKTLDYLIPDTLKDKVKKGTKVIVPLKNTYKTGFVFALKEKSDFHSLKSIQKALETIPSSLFSLANWMSRYYLTPLSKIIRCIIPTAIRKDIKPRENILLTSKKSNCG